MLSFLTKKKISDNTLSNIFVNGVFKMLEEGFDDLKFALQHDPELEIKPQDKHFNEDQFLWIVIAANISYIPQYFTALEQVKFMESVTQKFCQSLGVTREEFKKEIQAAHQLFYRLNHPSKNTKYAMSKAIFDQFELYDCQNEYFRKMRVANPITLKRLNELVECFLWDWENITKRYKITFE